MIRNIILTLVLLVSAAGLWGLVIGTWAFHKGKEVCAIESEKIAAQSDPIRKFSEPMHSVFITVCMQRGSTYEQCSCVESKVYMLEEDAKAGKDMTFAYDAAVAECTKGPAI